MTYNEAVNALISEGAIHTDPLYYAYCDGYYEAKTTSLEQAPHYIGVATNKGYFNNAEVQKKYKQGFNDCRK